MPGIGKDADIKIKKHKVKRFALLHISLLCYKHFFFKFVRCIIKTLALKFESL